MEQQQNNEKPAAAQADPVQMALTGRWTCETQGSDWGERVNVYAPAPTPLRRQVVAVGLPGPIARKMVAAMNSHDTLLTALERVMDILVQNPSVTGESRIQKIADMMLSSGVARLIDDVRAGGGEQWVTA